MRKIEVPWPIKIEENPELVPGPSLGFVGRRQPPLCTTLTSEPIKNIDSEEDAEKAADCENHAPQPQQRGTE